MTSYCMWFADWAPAQSKILATSIPEFKKFLCLVIFLSSIKKICCPRVEDRTFLQTWKVRGKAKDLRFEDKDFRMCPRELHLWKLAREVLVEQIIEFELRRLEHPGRIYISTTGYCHDKKKSLKANLCMDYCLPLKCCRRQCALGPE